MGQRGWGVGEGKESHQNCSAQRSSLGAISLETSRAPTNMVTKTFCAVLCIPWTGGKSHTTPPLFRWSNSIPVVFCDIWRRNSLHLMTASWGHLGCGLMSSANQEAELQNLIRNTARVMKNNHENCLLAELKTNFFNWLLKLHYQCN